MADYRFTTGDVVRYRWRVTGRIECWIGRDLIQVRIIDNPLRMPRYVIGSLVTFTVDELTLVRTCEGDRP